MPASKDKSIKEVSQPKSYLQQQQQQLATTDGVKSASSSAKNAVSRATTTTAADVTTLPETTLATMTTMNGAVLGDSVGQFYCMYQKLRCALESGLSFYVSRYSVAS